MIQTTDKVKEKLNTIPELPGIYKFLDCNGRIIYIGKSKTLNKRVKSYFVDNPKWDKVNRIAPYIDDLEFIVSDTHLEARLLECELIKSIKPIFNSQMKNDEKYAYIKIEEYNRYNPISIVYNRGEASFGPFRKKYYLYKITESLKNLYPIKKSNGAYDFEYHLMPLTMDNDTYKRNKEVLLEIFSCDIHMDFFIAAIKGKMKEAASIYKFETASMYRDIIFNLNYLKSGISGYRNMFIKNIVLKIPYDNGIKLFFISHGRIAYKKSYKRLSSRSYSLFIDNSLRLPVPSSSDEKMSIDYRDILYSEILSLPSNMVIYLD
ncbi:hypothetical protein E9840_02650 [Tissierella creatinini]|nr:hypothetical protein E9840_02650 [Tissierella creatinini]TJX61533.1 hypothetical protein E8P77_18320 [Soehngenia saccharolytica]